MSNFALRPINIEIRKKLLQKQRAFARYNTDTDLKAIASTPVNDEEMVQFFNRTTWAHLISLSVIKSSDDKYRLAIIGGGELEQDPGGKDVANKPLMRTSFEDIYRPFRDDNSSTLIKPISGIKSISTRYEGTLKSRREATVQFTIFSLEDLDRLSPHFFRVGGEVLLEFGWNSDKYDFSNTLGNQIITTYHNEGISGLEGISSIDLLRNNTAKDYEKAILDLKGDYEYVLGTIKNFDYSLRDDGGFDCTVVVSTVGMSLLDSKVNRDESPSQILQHQLYVEDEKATDKPHTTFYHVIENLPEIMTYSIINNYINTNGKLSRDEVSESKLSSDSSTSSTLSGEGPAGIDLNSSKSPYILSNDAFSKWYEKTSTSESGLLTETIEKFKKVAEAKSLQEWMEFKDINTDDKYYHNYYTNETVMKRTAIEVRELFEGDFGWDPTKQTGVLVNRISHIEHILSKIDGGNYTGLGIGNEDRGIYDYLNASFDGGDPGGYIRNVQDIWMEANKIDIISFMKHSPKRKKDILKSLSVESGKSLAVDGFLKDLGPVDIEKAVQTLVDMRSGELGEDYIDTSSLGTMPMLWTEVYTPNQLEGMPEQPSPINISPETDELPQSRAIGIPNPALEGNSDIFQEIYNRAKSMEEGLSGLDAPDEDEKESESFRTYGDILKTDMGGRFPGGSDGPRSAETIFVSYTQGNTVQAFTGFNWDKPGKFEDLARPFCESMFTEGKDISESDLKDLEKRSFPGKDSEIIFGEEIDEEREMWGLGSKKNETDDFLEGFLDGHLPKTWIRWGWFEDNIISKYLGFESIDSPITETNPSGKPVSIFKSVEPKVNKETDDIIDGYESNKMILPAKLKTTDVSEIIIPDRCKTLDKLTDHPGAGSVLYNAKLYGTLGTILENQTFGKTAKIYPVEIDYDENRNEEEEPSKRMGYIRNLFVEVDALREAFLNIGSLREGIDNFFHMMRRNFGPLHDFEIQSGKDEGMVGIVDNNLLYSLGLYKKPKTSSDININKLSMNMKVYEFPAWEKESIVKSQDLKVSIPDSMAITALYAGNEYEANMFNYDKSVGSVKVQKLAKFLKLDETGEDPRDKSLGSKSNMRPLFESKNFVSSGNGINEQGMIRYQHSGDFYKSLSGVSKTILASRGIDEPFYSDYKSSKVELGGTKRTPINRWDNGEDTGWYNPTGRLGDPISYGKDSGTNYRLLMEYELEFDVFSQVEGNFSALNGLLSLGLTIDGTAGIFPGNSYISKYLPIAFEKRTVGKSAGEYPLIFQATNIEHEINPSGWNTTINGMPRLNNKAFSQYVIDGDKKKPGDVGYEAQEAGESSKIEIEIDSQITDGISRFLNFFNLNRDFAVKSMKDIIGINVSGVDIDYRDIGSFVNFMNVNYDMKNENLISRVDPLHLNQFKESDRKSDPGYADYTHFYNALNGKSRTVPARLPKDAMYKKAVVGSNPKIKPPVEQKYNPLEMLLFLQISSVITGITYNTMKFNRLFGGSTVPPTVSRIFYAHALSDMMTWPSGRPKELMNNSLVSSIQNWLVDPKNEESKEGHPTGLPYRVLEAQEKLAIYKYFGVGYSKRMQKGGGYKETFTWSKEMWGENGPGRGDSFTTDELIEGLVKLEPTIPIWEEDPFSGDEIDDKYILIGPIYAGITETNIGTGLSESLWYISKLTDNKYAEFTIAFWNILFAVILKNELGIPMITGVSGEWAIRTPNWDVFNKELLRLYKEAKEQGTTDSILSVNEKEISTIDSKKIFEHALKCQYLINNPSP